ncbi:MULTISPECIES: ATP synthase subunit I [unclassified Roseitalea]|uniref:N-ATPase subunit AtpR n=1 Tax=unclassified Roseitalea TaxID=2639107 RepID=UPI00273F0E73|nr:MULTISPECIES: ATP synthase subunit I [unclassified Roseitalea]
MIETAPAMADLALALAAGAAFGGLHFGLLWLSVNRLAHGGRAWVFAAGALARMALVVAALVWFLVIADTGLVELGVAALGFLAVRLAATRIVKRGLQER